MLLDYEAKASILLAANLAKTIAIRGTEVDVYRQTTQTVQDEVYGVHSGERQQSLVLENVKALLPEDALVAFDLMSAAGLSADYAYTQADIRIGDTMKVRRADSRKRNYQVTGMNKMGITTNVVQRLKVSALGD